MSDDEKVARAIELCKARNGRPQEDDWDLAAAALSVALELERMRATLDGIKTPHTAKGGAE